MSSQPLYTAYTNTCKYLIRKYSIQRNTFYIMIINALLKKKSKGRYICYYREIRLMHSPIEHLRKYYRFNESVIRIKRITKRHHDKYIPNYSPLPQRSILFKRENHQDQLKNKILNAEYRRKTSINKRRTINDELMLNSEAYDSIYKISEQQNDSIIHTLFDQNNRDKEDTEDNYTAMSRIITLISLCEKNSTVVRLRNKNNRNSSINSDTNIKCIMSHTNGLFNNKINNSHKDEAIKCKSILSRNSSKETGIETNLSDKFQLTKNKLKLKLLYPQESVTKKRTNLVAKQTLNGYNIKLIAKRTKIPIPITLTTVNSLSQIKRNYGKPKIISKTSLGNSPNKGLLKLKYDKLNQIKESRALPLLESCNSDPLRYINSNQAEAK